MRVSRVATALIVLSVSLLPASPAMAGQEIVFEGHGWGHGMGLSQWGAYARALEGDNATEIVTAYYPTASVVTTSQATSASWFHTDSTPVWVNMLGATPYTSPTAFQLRATAPGLVVCQQEPKSEAFWRIGDESIYIEILEQELLSRGFDPGPVDGSFDASTDAAVKAFQTAEGLAVDGIVGKNTKSYLWPPDSGDRCVIETPLPTTTITITSDGSGNCLVPGASALGDCLGSIRNLSPTTRAVLPGKTDGGLPVELAHGSVRIRPDLDSSSGNFEGVHVLLEIGLEDYVAGIDEVMNWWAGAGANEALKAQAIAARTYGLRNVLSYGELGQLTSGSYPFTDNQDSFGTRRDQCWCHVFSNTYSQVYNGWTREIETGGVWSAASQATADRVLTAPGHGVLWALYTSSNGGATESHNDYHGYAGSSKFSYLVSVPDPYSLTGANPYANWSKTFDPGFVAQKAGLDELIGVTVTTTNESGSARTVAFHGYDKGEFQILEKTGAWVKSAFGLRSRYFTVSWGDVDGQPSPRPVFTDIDESIFVGDIEWAAERGIAIGCNPPNNDLFCPSRPVTREEMAVFMVRALDLPPASTDYFTDDESSPYEDEINRMAQAGITRGCGGTKFCPKNTVDRGQMAAFLVRALGLTDDGGGNLFVDDDNSIFEGDIDRLGTAGITKGCNPPQNTRYCPGLDVERGAMMAFLHRAIGD